MFLWALVWFYLSVPRSHYHSRPNNTSVLLVAAVRAFMYAHLSPVLQCLCYKMCTNIDVNIHIIPC